MTKKEKTKRALALILAVLLVDQLVKIYVKTHFFLGEEVAVFDWFRIRFVENNGMAFGMEIFDNKIFLTMFRILAVGAIGYYLSRIIKDNAPWGYVLAIAGVIAGAFGNIIDCVFYGEWFTDSFGRTADFVGGGGYAPYFYGRVVDMLYFPLVESQWPEWMPFVGGEHFIFFSPVFNIADSAICVSIFYIILFQRDYLLSEDEKPKKKR